MKLPIHVLSLGAGVQSSTLALMAAAGEVSPMPVAAIFADTQAEPASVYQWLDWLEKQLPFPVIRVTAGNLMQRALTIRKRRDGNGYWAPSDVPAYTTNSDGTKGHVQRQCTVNYKLRPLLSATLRLMRQHKADSVVQWIGISRDEALRMKPSRHKRIKNRWPLIELEMERRHCLAWWEKRSLPKPPRSACVFCPFKRNSEWRKLRDEEPEEFRRAVQFEKDYQRVKAETGNMRGIPWLHDSRVPLDQVDLSTDVERGQGLLAGFGNECEGMCGL